MTEPSAYQYFCRQCGYERDGLLDHAAGIGGYSWACPKCKSNDIGSREVIPCPCGNRIFHTGLPSDQVALLLPSAISFEFEPVDRFPDHIPDVYECEKCGRLGISPRTGKGGAVRWYSPDDGQYGKVAADTRS